MKLFFLKITLCLIVCDSAFGINQEPRTAMDRCNPFITAYRSDPNAFRADELKSIDLEASIKNSGLTLSQIESIRKNGASVEDLYSMLKRMFSQNSVLLGLSSPTVLYYAIAEAGGLFPWDKAYERHGIAPGEGRHTDLFMETLVRNEYEIVFMIPDQIWTHPQGVVTKRELYWLLQRPEAMKRVHFVFGASDVIDGYGLLRLDPESQRMYPMRDEKSEERQISRLARALKAKALKKGD